MKKMSFAVMSGALLGLMFAHDGFSGSVTRRLGETEQELEQTESTGQGEIAANSPEWAAQGASRHFDDTELIFNADTNGAEAVLASSGGHGAPGGKDYTAQYPALRAPIPNSTGNLADLMPDPNRDGLATNFQKSLAAPATLGEHFSEKAGPSFFGKLFGAIGGIIVGLFVFIASPFTSIVALHNNGVK